MSEYRDKVVKLLKRSRELIDEGLEDPSTELMCSNIIRAGGEFADYLKEPGIDRFSAAATLAEFSKHFCKFIIYSRHFGLIEPEDYDLLMDYAMLVSYAGALMLEEKEKTE